MHFNRFCNNLILFSLFIFQFIRKLYKMRLQINKADYCLYFSVKCVCGMLFMLVFLFYKSIGDRFDRVRSKVPTNFSKFSNYACVSSRVRERNKNCIYLLAVTSFSFGISHIHVRSLITKYFVGTFNIALANFHSCCIYLNAIFDCGYYVTIFILLQWELKNLKMKKKNNNNATAHDEIGCILYSL